jgi:hypothetical protein
MKRVVEYESKYGPIAVELDEPAASGPSPAGKDRQLEKASNTFERALDVIPPTAMAVLDAVGRIDSLPDGRPPDGVSVEFGVKVGAGVAVVATANAEATISVTLTWSE